MKRIFGMIMAFALCLMWCPPVKASSACPKKELKQVICSMPVLAIDNQYVDVLKWESQISYVSAIHSHDNTYQLQPYMISEKCCFRISRGKHFSYVSELRRNESIGLHLNAKVNHCKVFRQYSLAC